MARSEKSDQNSLRQLTLFQQGGLAKTYPSLASAVAWLVSVAGYSFRRLGLYKDSDPDGCFSSKSLASFLRIKVRTSQSSSKRLPNAGMAWYGECLILNTLESPRDVVECSLSDILETWPDWGSRNPDKTYQDWLDYLQKFYLSAQAARGILRRAEERGRELPPHLKQALQVAAVGEVGP